MHMNLQYTMCNTCSAGIQKDWNLQLKRLHLLRPAATVLAAFAADGD